MGRTRGSALRTGGRPVTRIPAAGQVPSSPLMGEDAGGGESLCGAPAPSCHSEPASRRAKNPTWHTRPRVWQTEQARAPVPYPPPQPSPTIGGRENRCSSIAGLQEIPSIAAVRPEAHPGCHSPRTVRGCLRERSADLAPGPTITRSGTGSLAISPHRVRREISLPLTKVAATLTRCCPGRPR